MKTRCFTLMNFLYLEVVKKWKKELASQKRLWSAVVTVVTLLSFSGCGIIAQVNPDSAKLAVKIPIADLHFHPNSRLSPSEFKEWMDDNGVRWAGSGVRFGNPTMWREFSDELGASFIAFAGQGELNSAYFQGGVSAMEDSEYPIVSGFLRQVEEDLKMGRVKGVGEIFVNNSHSYPNPRHGRKAKADAPTFRLLYQLIAQYGAFLAFHMENESDSVEQMERLLASDRKGRILWYHCGVNASSNDVRILLARHPNLFCGLASRYLSRNSKRDIFGEKWIYPGWLKLIEEFPDRFLIGTDVLSRSEYDKAINAVRSGLLPYLRPSTARKVAHENAQYLFGLNK